MQYFLSDAAPEVLVCRPDRADALGPMAQAAGCRACVTLGRQRDGDLIQRASPFPDAFATVPRRADDLASILYTSGTTGRSKGAMLTHGNLASNARTLKKYWAWQPSDVLLHALPIFHIHGLFVALHAALMNGSKMLWLARFDLDQVIRYLPRATVMMGVPTFYVRLLNDARVNRACTAGMRLFISGSAPLLEETFTRFEAQTGHTILERYGMSETVMMTSNPYQGLRKPGTVGRPLPGIDLRLVNAQGQRIRQQQGKASAIGGVEVRGPNVFLGYWRMPEQTKEAFTADGWFRTGDMGQWDEDGYLSLVGRSKDLIITGGYNVYPKEIELLIDEMPGVEESAVIGLPDSDFGEAVTAVVVPRAGALLDPKAMMLSLKGTIAGYKVPKRIYLVDALPRNTMCKVQKNLLRDQFAGS
jgi:malonyl-CoA/methylmalonyl-CoA synthetase